MGSGLHSRSGRDGSHGWDVSGRRTALGHLRIALSP